QQETGMAVALITHDLAVVAERCRRVAVMYAGQVVEIGPTADVIGAPLHPYTKGLIACLPRLDDLERELVPIKGQVPDLVGIDGGCRFRNRCPLAIPACAEPVALEEKMVGRKARCIRSGEATP